MIDTEITYAIGDIHGRSDLLAVLLREIETHAAGRPSRIVFLGDYIDRGPDSAGVIRMVRDLAVARAGLVHCLMGNHEQMLLLAKEDREAHLCWLDNGGRSTLESFKAGGPEQLPDDVVGWMRQLPTFYEDTQRYFVHAGLDPSSPLGEQSDTDRLWIREPFLSADHDFGKHVVHGHTPVRGAIGASPPMPDEREHRTNIDTGAVFGGPLTAAVFDDRHMHPIGFLQVQQDGYAQFLTSRRQVLDLMTRLAGHDVAAPVSVAGDQVAPFHPSARGIAASVMILGLAGTGIALAAMNWAGTSNRAANRQSNANVAVAVSGSGTNAPVAAPTQVAAGSIPRADKPAPEKRATVPALPLRPTPEQADAMAQAPNAPPRIAQDQVTTRPASVPATALPDADRPPPSPLPMIAQDQIATPRESLTDMAMTASNAPRQSAPVMPQIAQDQSATRADGEPQLADATLLPPSSRIAANPGPSAVATEPQPLQTAVRPDARSVAQAVDGIPAAQFVLGPTEAVQLPAADQQKPIVPDLTPTGGQQRESAPVVDEHTIERKLAGLLDDIPRVDGLAGLHPPARTAEGTAPTDIARPPEQTTQPAPTQPSPNTDAITRKLADLLPQVPQLEMLPGLAPGSPPSARDEPLRGGGAGTAPTAGVEAHLAEQKLDARQNASPATDSLSGPAKGSGADASESSRQDTEPRVVATIPPASSQPRASRKSSPTASPIAVDPVQQSAPIFPPRSANTPASIVPPGSITRTDPDQSGLSRQFAPLRLASGASPSASDPGDPASLDRQSVDRGVADQQLRDQAGTRTRPAALARTPVRLADNACRGKLQIVKRGDQIIRVICLPRATGSVTARRLGRNAGFFSRLFWNEGSGGGVNSVGSIADNAGPAGGGGGGGAGSGRGGGNSNGGSHGNGNGNNGNGNAGGNGKGGGNGNGGGNGEGGQGGRN